MECVVVGGGVVGLATARALARAGREVLVLESEPTIGTMTSSRNSGVIHAGIYYPKDSLKARFCVAGKQALYEFCESHGVSHARIGKLIVATEEEELPALDEVLARARANGVDDLTRLEAHEARRLEPEVACAGALLSPSTGVIDVHELMLELQGDAETHGAMVAFLSPFAGGEVLDSGFRIEVGGAAPMSLACDLLVNSAGLFAQRVAEGLQGLEPRHVPPVHYSKGNYFGLQGPSPFRRLIYPVPRDAWLGVHVALDLAGRCRFGPDLHWVDTLDYDVDPSTLPEFYRSIRRFWPGLPDGALHPDYTGIRPKLYAKGAPSRDFVVQAEDEHGVPGLVNLFGIESPGLTSAMAIAEHVSRLLER